MKTRSVKAFSMGDGLQGLHGLKVLEPNGVKADQDDIQQYRWEMINEALWYNGSPIVSTLFKDIEQNAAVRFAEVWNGGIKL